VRLTAERLAAYGRVEAVAPKLSKQDRKRLDDYRQKQIAPLQQQIQALAQQKADLQAKLSQQPAGADPAVAQQFAAQIRTLDAQIASKREELQTATRLYLNLEMAAMALKDLDMEPPGEGLSLTFAQAPARIVSADLTMHFYPAPARVIPAAPSAFNDAPITQTFHLTANSGESLLHSTLRAEHSGIISWVELTRLDYADGASWQSSAPRQCTAAPSLFVPVDLTR
jgi:hypothetical protein